MSTKKVIKKQQNPECLDTIGERIKEIMKGMKQTAFAKLLGKDRADVHRWVSPKLKAIPPLDALIKMAEVKDIDLTWLITGKGPAQIVHEPSKELTNSDIDRQTESEYNPSIPDKQKEDSMIRNQLIAELRDRIADLKGQVKWLIGKLDDEKLPTKMKKTERR